MKYFSLLIPNSSSFPKGYPEERSWEEGRVGRSHVWKVARDRIYGCSSRCPLGPRPINNCEGSDLLVTVPWLPWACRSGAAKHLQPARRDWLPIVTARENPHFRGITSVFGCSSDAIKRHELLVAGFCRHRSEHLWKGKLPSVTSTAS